VLLWLFFKAGINSTTLIINDVLNYCAKANLNQKLNLYVYNAWWHQILRTWISGSSVILQKWFMRRATQLFRESNDRLLISFEMETSNGSRTKCHGQNGTDKMVRIEQCCPTRGPNYFTLAFLFPPGPYYPQVGTLETNNDQVTHSERSTANFRPALK